jgi:glucose/mannose-6-phosphate isomerase
MTEPRPFDDVGPLERLDSEDVLGAVERFADQCREGWAIGQKASGLPDGEGIDSVAVLGMGGSGVSGDVAAAVLGSRLPLPFAVIKGYGPLPGWIGPSTLVFAVSYSGSTEETVSALQEASERGARLVAISSGGPLAELARRLGAAHLAIPPGLQPRASLGYLTLPLLGALQKVGLTDGLDGDVDETIHVIERLAESCHRSRPTAENPAKDLAERILHKVAIVYGGSQVAATAAMRFKCDINEYGKVPAFWNYFPELNHNEIVGWTGLTELTRENMALVYLRDADEHERVSLRFEITRDLVEKNVSEVIELRSEGTSALARILSLVLVTQLAAIYVGLGRGVDPGPVDIIQNLKAELTKR